MGKPNELNEASGRAALGWTVFKRSTAGNSRSSIINCGPSTMPAAIGIDRPNAAWTPCGRSDAGSVTYGQKSNWFPCTNNDSSSVARRRATVAMGKAQMNTSAASEHFRPGNPGYAASVLRSLRGAGCVPPPLKAPSFC